MIESKSIWNVFVIRLSMFICVASIPLVICSQEKKFSSFELVYDIPQQVSESSQWPKYGLDDIRFIDDTLSTLIIKEGYITNIATSSKNISHKKINFPPQMYPVYFLKHDNKWYFINDRFNFGYLDDNGKFITLIKDHQIKAFENFFIIDNRIAIYDTNTYNGIYVLYDLEGKLLSKSRVDHYYPMYPYVYHNKIIDGLNEITITEDSIYTSEIYDYNKYGEESAFVGGCKNMGYFVSWSERNKLIIRNLTDKSIKDRFIIPVKFKDTNSGLPEEELINLRVFSKDNNTFYFVTLKYGHLLIYKATLSKPE